MLPDKIKKGVAKKPHTTRSQFTIYRKLRRFITQVSLQTTRICVLLDTVKYLIQLMVSIRLVRSTYCHKLKVRLCYNQLSNHRSYGNMCFSVAHCGYMYASTGVLPSLTCPLNPASDLPTLMYTPNLPLTWPHNPAADLPTLLYPRPILPPTYLPFPTCCQLTYLLYLRLTHALTECPSFTTKSFQVQYFTFPLGSK